MKAYLVLVTTPNRRTSEKISKGLVDSRLAACVNILPGVQSRYRWKGKVETGSEELLLIKTNAARLSRLTQWVEENHPYEVCEVLALRVEKGSENYLAWIEKSLR
jgi:periplasmic divalent cation tolerance protein